MSLKSRQRHTLDPAQKRPNSGISLVQVVIAMAAVAGLSVLVASLMSNLNSSQQQVRLASLATDLESRHRAALLSSRALYNSRTSADNADLATCFNTGCPLDVATPLTLVDAGGKILVPKAQPGYIDDSGQTCTPSATNPACQWQVTATYTPRCTGACTTPASYDLVLTLAWAKPAGSKINFVMRPKDIRSTVAKEMFATPPATTQCSPDQFVAGINPDGTINCRSFGSCPADKMFNGFNPDGTLNCVDKPKLQCTQRFAAYSAAVCPADYPILVGVGQYCNAGGGTGGYQIFPVQTGADGEGYADGFCVGAYGSFWSNAAICCRVK